jgi:hypothetical protein
MIQIRSYEDLVGELAQRMWASRSVTSGNTRESSQAMEVWRGLKKKQPRAVADLGFYEWVCHTKTLTKI